MELNRLQKLAGLPLTESKAPQVLAESEKTSKVEIRVSEPMIGQLGNMVILDGSPATTALAKMLGIPEGWKKTKIGKVWASFDSDYQLAFFDDERDYQSDEDHEED